MEFYCRAALFGSFDVPCPEATGTRNVSPLGKSIGAVVSPPTSVGDQIDSCHISIQIDKQQDDTLDPGQLLALCPPAAERSFILIQ